MQDHINLLLPPEVLIQVFYLLAPRDIKAAMLVCRLWREVGKAPSLWSWVVLRLYLGNQTDMLEFLETWRMKNVREVRVRKATDEVIQAVVKQPRLRLKYESIDLNDLDATLLARARPQMERLPWTEFCWSAMEIPGHERMRMLNNQA